MKRTESMLWTVTLLGVGGLIVNDLVWLVVVGVGFMASAVLYLALRGRPWWRRRSA